MVAAWIRALTGVGPSIASSNQDCSGNCADLPQAASSNINPMPRIVLRSAVDALLNTSLNANPPNVVYISITPTDRPMSPTRLTTNAFFAATAAEGLCCQNPISRYEARPTPSQPAYSSR